MVSAVPVVLAVSTGVVVIAVAAAVVLVVLIVAVSMRGRQKRAAQQRGEARQHVDEERAQAARAARDRDAARTGGDDLRSGG
jgi:Flp pilus assembly protein TadB